MKISSKLLVGIGVMVGATAISGGIMYHTSQKFKRLSQEQAKTVGLIGALTDFRAASTQVTVEAFQSAYLTHGKEREDFEEAIENAQAKLLVLHKISLGSETHTEQFDKLLSGLVQILTLSLDSEKEGNVIQARALMKEYINNVYLKNYLNQINSELSLIEKSALTLAKDYDQTARVLTMTSPLVMVFVLVLLCALLLPISFTFKHRMDQLISHIRKFNFDLDCFPEMVEGEKFNRDEISDVVVHINHLSTKLNESKKLIQLQQKDLVASSRLSSLGEMAGGIAHEINNPLAIIVGRLALLRTLLEKVEFKSSETALRHVDKMTETSHRITKIVKGLRVFARDGSQDAFEEVTVQAIVEDTFSFCAERFKAHGIVLTNACDPFTKIKCIPVQLGQVLLNLLNNAHDAVRGQENAWVKIESSHEDDWVILAVSDSGKGIPEDIADQIMLPFFTTKAVGEGTGLGLSISQGMIKSMNGELTLNRHSKNTQFLIKIPAAVANEHSVKAAS